MTIMPSAAIDVRTSKSVPRSASTKRSRVLPVIVVPPERIILGPQEPRRLSGEGKGCVHNAVGGRLDSESEFVADRQHRAVFEQHVAPDFHDAALTGIGDQPLQQVGAD